MTDDVRIATSLRGHRKTKRLKRRLGEAGCWSLVCLLLFAGEQRWTGDLSGMTDEDIEEESDWNGDSGVLVAALIEVRFLVGESLARKIHDWQEHNPYAASKGTRIQKGKAGAAARWAKARAEASSTEFDARCRDQACSAPAARTSEQCSPTPTPALTPPVLSMRQQADSLGYAVATEPDALIAILASSGIAISPTSPDLMAAAREGVRPEQLREWIGLEPGRSAVDVLRTALRQVRELRAYHPALADALSAKGSYG